MRTNADITIYNKYFDKDTRLDKYQRTVLRGVFWNCVKAYNRLQSGMQDADAVTIYIPFGIKADREYIEPKEFEKLEDKSGYFTLAEGDRVVKDVIDFEIEGKLSDLDREYEAFTITSVDTKDFGSPHLRHWQVGGR